MSVYPNDEGMLSDVVSIFWDVLWCQGWTGIFNRLFALTVTDSLGPGRARPWTTA